MCVGPYIIARRYIYEAPEGFYCIVNGQRFGVWRSRAEARGGMQTEIIRAERRAAAIADQAPSGPQPAHTD